ncbi:hypothetical protein DP125_13150 [Clostridium tetani]|uniref:Uncharacterized protein n=1 Tax=Clostridium tetani TaxID=1513 RepID=A0ABY0ESJ6_CLOTA|nr:tail fiber protein [Clostridium tetani]RXI56926.1 hypothetical protein DP131_06405 [Clostridium tetani]RXI57635.1 hypothetical protein DP125_13150 [Clostridium tetani]
MISIDKFTEKLNKIDGNTYVIEEEVELKDGVYEGELQHDNISNTSVRVYTGPKLTGNKIENFILSTPSLTPWKKEIKIFTKVDKCYITYETPGDTVEADDINKVQGSIVKTQIEIEQVKKETKNLDKNKVDNIIGKQLSTEDYSTEEKKKLRGIEDNANNYIHPLTHSADMIEETDTKQFVTQAEKDKWNSINDSEGCVKSVNNKTGDVMLNASDVGAEPSINKKTGFNLDKSDSVTSTSSSTLATSKAVKSAYDKALQAFQLVSDGKLKIATAITDKGITTSSSDTFQKMADNINNISINGDLRKTYLKPFSKLTGNIRYINSSRELMYIIPGAHKLDIYNFNGVKIKSMEYPYHDNKINNSVFGVDSFIYGGYYSNYNWFICSYNGTRLREIDGSNWGFPGQYIVPLNKNGDYMYEGDFYDVSGTKKQNMLSEGNQEVVLALTDEIIIHIYKSRNNILVSYKKEDVNEIKELARWEGMEIKDICFS